MRRVKSFYYRTGITRCDVLTHGDIWGLGEGMSWAWPRLGHRDRRATASGESNQGQIHEKTVKSSSFLWAPAPAKPAGAGRPTVTRG